ncbi:MAG: S-layer homology domain-containing protein, partial [Chloroflexota bacterium]|nr:S-layer homology domain-containing protein [Chloroflexota bacterium]
GANRPYFRPGNNASRGQLSKIVSNAAGFDDTPAGQTFEDVPTNSTFYVYIERLTGRGVMGGYECGRPDEPCVAPNNRPYFRPSDNVTRGQGSKIVANTFFPNCETARP